MNPSSHDFDLGLSERLIAELSRTVATVSADYGELRGHEIANALTDLLAGALIFWERREGAEIVAQALEELPDFLRHIMRRYRRKCRRSGLALLQTEGNA